MGKALFDRQLVAGHMVGYIYKHILGWPVTFGDLAMVDDEYYNNLKQLQTLATSGEDLSMLCLDFTTTQDIMGVKEEKRIEKLTLKTAGGVKISAKSDEEAKMRIKIAKRAATYGEPLETFTEITKI